MIEFIWYFLLGLSIFFIFHKYVIQKLKIKKELQKKLEVEKEKKLKEARDRELKEKQKKYYYIKSLLPLLTEANKDFNNLCNVKNKYFTNFKLEQWRIKHQEIIELFDRDISIENIGLLEIEINEVKSFLNILSNSEEMRNNYNDDFVKIEYKNTNDLLSRIDGGKSLDKFQREAIFRDEDNSLVIAGAGCGKTTTIMGKVNYLNKHLEVDPKEILLISFTKKSAKDLAEKLNIVGSPKFEAVSLINKFTEYDTKKIHL